MTQTVRARIRLLLSAMAVAALVAGMTVPEAMGGPPDRVELRGRLNIVHGDEVGDHREHAHGTTPEHVLPNMEYWLDSGGNSYELRFPGHPPPAQSGDQVTVKGDRRGNSIHVAAFQTAAAAGGNGKGKPSGGNLNPVIGARDVLVIAFNFAADPSNRPFTLDEIRGQVFVNPNSTANYVSETSFTQSSLRGRDDGTASDKDGLPGDVTGWFTINEGTNSCRRDRWTRAAQKAVTSAGWNLDGYEHLAYVFPQVAACNWGGLAEIGGNESWYNGWNHAPIYAHEFGHNFTLFHARTLSCTGADGERVVLSSSCTYLEYGDPFDVMGWSGKYRQFNGRNKRRITWLGSGNVVDATPGIEYTVQPLERGTSGLQLLRYQRSSGEYFYVEARTPSGTFDAFTPGEDVVTGALIHTGPDVGQTGNSYLLDTAPYPPPPPNPVYADEFFDAALQPGEALIDPASGVSIETTAVNADGSVNVIVRTGVTNTAPAADTGTGHTTPPGVAHTHDGATATDSTKNLSSFHWSWASCPGACPELGGTTSGQLSGGTDEVPGPTYTPTVAGSYRLALTVRDTAGARVTTYVTDTVT